VAFYRSPVTLSHCTLIDTLAPAALYVTHARFECEACEFGLASAIALSGEYAEGRVSSSRFYDVLGHAIAARGSRLDVQDVSLLRVYDHGLLARQNSVVTVRGGRAEDVGLALASSDASHVQVEGVVIVQAWKAGLAAYASEPGGEPASVHASEVTFESEDAVQALVQPGSSVRLNGSAIGARELDAHRLSWREPITATIRPLGYRLGSAIQLVGYDIDRPLVAPGDPLHLTLYWHAIDSLDSDYTVFIHVLDAGGEMVAGGDAMPRQNAYPTTQWQPGPVIDDRHVVPLDVPAGDYHVVLGLYHLASGQRLPVYGPDGAPVAGDAISLDAGFRVD
jgi:hypothetical protein